jgi:hypothetical protein
MKVASILAILLMAAGVASCSDAQRPLSSDKTTYGGKADEELSAGQVDELRQRALRQTF